MDRRQLIGAATVLASLSTTRTFAQASPSDTELVSELPPLPADLASQASQAPAPYLETELVGSGKPLDSEIKIANEILKGAPIGVAPIEVAQYLLAVGAGAYGAAWRPFAREWPVRANPVIFHFFSATQTKPLGDTTAWCAAFMNWCILRGRATSVGQIGKSPGSFSLDGDPFSTTDRQRHSTNSAASGSFRCWAETKDPVRGDIVVFKNAGTDGMTAACLGQGHVAFYLGVPRPGWVRVLGGNQSQAGSNGAVTVADMKTEGPGSRFMKFAKLK